MLSREISLQRSPKFDIRRRHFETNAQWPARDRPLSVTSNRARDFAVFILEVIVDLQPYSSQNSPELAPTPEGSKSENEEVNNRLEGTFWCTCE